MRRYVFRIVTEFVALTLMTTAALAAPRVTTIRVGENVERTRFVMEVSAPVEYTVFTLADPYRVVVDFPRVEWDVSDNQQVGEGLVDTVRYGRYRHNTSRLVLDLDAPAEIAKIFTLDPQGRYPYRFVIDLAPTSRQAFLKRTNQPSNRPSRAARENRAKVPRAPPERSKQVIVVDAGHGGIDPGALGRSGPDEKHVTLEVAREVKRQLEATGRYDVILTRNRDVFLSLGERVEVARRAKANLFISIHADTLNNRRVRGAGVYTLSETASDKEAAALARKENRSDIIAGVNLDGESDDVTSILIDLAQRETMNYSAEFAQHLVPALGNYTALRTNSHRFAGFSVLKAPDVPSVLVELGFLSNPQDARFMYSAEGQRHIALAIVRATDRFFAGMES